MKRRSSWMLRVALLSVVMFACVPPADGERDGSGGRIGGTGGGASGTGGAAGSAGGTGGASCVPQGGTTTPPATFATVKEALEGFGPVESCWSNPCHAKFGMVPPAMPLVLAPEPDLYSRMMTYVSAACGNIPLVNPGKPDQSALVKIITGPCGDTPRMPYQCGDEQCLPPEYVAAIRQWVANCAPER